MQIILEKIDKDVYGDIVITPQEVIRIQRGEMVDGTTFFEKKNWYLGVRVQGVLEYEEKNCWPEEDCEDDEGV